MSVIDPPTWATTDVYDALDDPRLLADFDRLEALADELDDYLELRGVRGGSPHAPTADDAAIAAEVLRMLDDANEIGRVIYTYLQSFLRVDASNAVAWSLAGRMGQVLGHNRGALARFTAWLGEFGASGVASLAGHDATVAEHAGMLSRLADRSSRQMSEHEETLYAQLVASGSGSWQQLHETITSRLMVDVELPSGRRTMVVGQARALVYDQDSSVREAAFRAELRAWPQVADVCAAALNSIKGEAVVVNDRRGWPSALDASLHNNAVDRATYDAMTTAVVESFPMIRRFLRAKAAVHGHPGGLPWWDLEAPLPLNSREWTWAECIQMVRDVFDGYSPELGGLVNRAVEERWIDALPRPGKGPGASCLPFVADRSLIVLNFTGALGQVVTTAHELGHAYHNVQLSRRPATLRDVPMSLAETASIFCETLFIDASLQHADGVDRLAMLDLDLSGATQVLADIHTRVLFETAVFDRRSRGPLPADRLCELMNDGQRAVFGDSVRGDTFHPYMWAVKRHYYTSNYYNWQYTFGQLLGLGLFARFRDEPESFRHEYDDMLASAGNDTATALAARFGIDVHDVGFWRSSTAIIADRVADYETLVDDQAPT